MRNVLLGEDNDAAKSDEAFLEQTKLKAREALGHALFGGGEAAHSDSAFLEQAKLKAGKPWKISF